MQFWNFSERINVEDLAHIKVCLPDCSLKIHSRYPDPEEGEPAWTQSGEKKLENQVEVSRESELCARKKRGDRSFPKGVSNGGRVSKRVLGWGSEGGSTNSRLQGMAE